MNSAAFPSGWAALSRRLIALNTALAAGMAPKAAVAAAMYGPAMVAKVLQHPKMLAKGMELGGDILSPTLPSSWLGTEYQIIHRIYEDYLE